MPPQIRSQIPQPSSARFPERDIVRAVRRSPTSTMADVDPRNCLPGRTRSSTRAANSSSAVTNSSSSGPLTSTPVSLAVPSFAIRRPGPRSVTMRRIPGPRSLTGGEGINGVTQTVVTRTARMRQRHSVPPRDITQPDPHHGLAARARVVSRVGLTKSGSRKRPREDEVEAIDLISEDEEEEKQEEGSKKKKKEGSKDVNKKQDSGDETKANCSICLEIVEDNTILIPCNHIFHKQCIDTWFKDHRSCPICRSEVEKYRFQIKSKTLYQEKKLPPLPLCNHRFMLHVMAEQDPQFMDRIRVIMSDAERVQATTGSLQSMAERLAMLTSSLQNLG